MQADNNCTMLIIWNNIYFQRNNVKYKTRNMKENENGVLLLEKYFENHCLTSACCTKTTKYAIIMLDASASASSQNSIEFVSNVFSSFPFSLAMSPASSLSSQPLASSDILDPHDML